MTITIHFPDGGTISAATAAGVLNAWRREQWRSLTVSEFRAELAKRAYIWSGATIDPNGTAREFLLDMECAKLISVHKEDN